MILADCLQFEVYSDNLIELLQFDSLPSHLDAEWTQYPSNTIPPISNTHLEYLYYNPKDAKKHNTVLKRIPERKDLLIPNIPDRPVIAYGLCLVDVWSPAKMIWSLLLFTFTFGMIYALRGLNRWISAFLPDAKSIYSEASDAALVRDQILGFGLLIVYSIVRYRQITWRDITGHLLFQPRQSGTPGDSHFQSQGLTQTEWINVRQ